VRTPTARAGTRDRAAPLTKMRIVEAALTIIDHEGLPALNMRRLGAQLDVGAMAVYKHFPNKDAILDGIVAAVLRDLAESATESDWREGFRAAFISLRSLLLAHPNALPLVASRPLSSPQFARRLESTRDLLLRAGLPEEEALHLLHAGISLTLGYLWLEAGGFVGELPDDAPFLRRVAGASHADAAATLVAAATWSRDRDFAAGLDLLIADRAGWREDAAGAAPESGA
jgi:AcrR family transcriptional regulator